MKVWLEMTGVWMVIVIGALSAALIFVLALLFLVDLTVQETRRARERQAREEVPAPLGHTKLFDQDALGE